MTATTATIAVDTKRTSRTLTASSTMCPEEDPMERQLRRIAGAVGRTPFEKRVWSLLCQIPPGHVTTYGQMAAFLGSSPRAVGNALRRNPFAPEVPCHRCVATGGGLGGFKGVRPAAAPSARRKGQTEEEGITLAEKRALLRKEGVRFDDRGRVLGTPFMAFRKFT